MILSPGLYARALVFSTKTAFLFCAKRRILKTGGKKAANVQLRSEQQNRSSFPEVKSTVKYMTEEALSEILCRSDRIIVRRFRRACRLLSSRLTAVEPVAFTTVRKP